MDLIWRYFRVVAFAFSFMMIGALSSPLSYGSLPGQNGDLVVGSTVPNPNGNPANWSSVWTIRPDGSKHRLTSEGVVSYSPAVSPDGRWLVYTRSPSAQLWIAPRDRFDLSKQITFTSFDWPIQQSSRDAVFAPDGRSVFYAAYQGYVGDGQDSWRLARYWIQSRKVVFLTPEFLTGGFSPRPAVSPDGEYLAYTSGALLHEEVRLLNIASRKSSVMSSDLPSRFPSFSPDGSHLVYMSLADGEWRVFVSRANGGQREMLPIYDDGLLVPVFSPDFEFVAVSKENEDGPDTAVVAELGSASQSELVLPGESSDLREWSRSRLFRLLKYSRKRSAVLVRVFNPGQLRIHGPGIRIRTCSVRKPGFHWLKVRWKPGRLASRIEVGFRPEGALGGIAFSTVRR